MPGRSIYGLFANTPKSMYPPQSHNLVSSSGPAVAWNCGAEATNSDPILNTECHRSRSHSTSPSSTSTPTPVHSRLCPPVYLHLPFPVIADCSPGPIQSRPLLPQSCATRKNTSTTRPPANQTTEQRTPPCTVTTQKHSQTTAPGTSYAQRSLTRLCAPAALGLFGARRFSYPQRLSQPRLPQPQRPWLSRYKTAPMSSALSSHRPNGARHSQRRARKNSRS